MKDPHSDLKAGQDERSEPPDFDALTPPAELVRGNRTRDDFFDVVLELNTPATVNEVADLADHGSDAAREYLDWFDRMGIVVQVSESPLRYRLNREYLTWRRIQRVRDEYDSAELVEYLETETERDRTFGAEFGVDTPAEVTISEYATATGESVEEVWEALTNWRTTRRRITILERALAAENDGSSGQPRTPA